MAMDRPWPWTDHDHGPARPGPAQKARRLLYKLTTPILYKLTVPTFWVPPAPPSNISAATIQEYRANTQKKNTVTTH